MAEERTGAKRRRRDADATRRRILSAAEREFSRYGFHGARVARIARKARANKRMLYVYFGDKAALYRHVFMRNYRAVTEQEELLELTEEDLPRLTERILETYFAFHERNPDFWRFLAWENLDPGAGIDPAELRESSGRVMAHLGAIYRRGQERGLVRTDVSFETYVFTLMAESFFYRSNTATMTGTLDADVSDEAYRRRLVNESARMIDAGVMTG